MKQDLKEKQEPRDEWLSLWLAWLWLLCAVVGILWVWMFL